MEFQKMAGTKAGGKKAAATNKKKFGADFYVKLGALGGRASNTGGFYADRDLARRAGEIGGRNSRRGAAKKK
jgi:general stress protein YciG